MSLTSYCLGSSIQRPPPARTSILCTDCGTDFHEIVFHKGKLVRRKNLRPLPLTEDDARKIIWEFYLFLEKNSIDEKESYTKTNADIPATKAARWSKYTDKETLGKYFDESVRFVKENSEFRTRQLFSPQQLRFLVAVQHLVQEDAAEMDCPAYERKHLDTFEGKSGCVNTQLVKDVHRSEWSIEGQGFSLQKVLQSRGLETASLDIKRECVNQFQQQFVHTLESYLLEFARKRGLSDYLSGIFIKVVTTEMSQCGLANLDQAGTASKYFVSGHGLEQRTVYNLSQFNKDSVKLSILCMKTSFSTYHTEQTLEFGDMSPNQCSKSSYLYQYATIQITPDIIANNINVTVIDALDEAHIVPPVEL